jgi:hypothetical protein
MKIQKSQKGEGFTIYASVDELRMVGNGVAMLKAAPEERALQRKVVTAVVTALPDVEGDAEELEGEADPDADLFDNEDDGLLK